MWVFPQLSTDLFFGRKARHRRSDSFDSKENSTLSRKLQNMMTTHTECTPDNRTGVLGRIVVHGLIWNEREENAGAINYPCSLCSWNICS